MLSLTSLSLQLILSTVIAGEANCGLAIPPDVAGETQAHGVILYIYPRSHAIDRNYSGCQNQWFFDDDHFRKLSVVYYKDGLATAYDNINLNGDIAYHCDYRDKILSSSSDDRCPNHSQLRKKTYRSGCHSQAKLNSSDSYAIAFSDCTLR